MKHFFSYSRHDTEFVKQLANDLKKREMNVWLDQLDIPVGAKWDTCIEQALNEAIGIILVLSNSSVQSDNVMDEVNYAITKGKYIIPIKLDDCEVPFRLARIQQINFQGDYEKSVETVVANIHLHINARQPNAEPNIVAATDVKTIADPPPIAISEDTSDTKTAQINADPLRITWKDDANEIKTAKINSDTPRLSWKDDTNEAETIKTKPGTHHATKVDDTPATKTINAKFDAPGAIKQNKKIIYALCIATGVLLLFWLFGTPSGDHSYSSVLTSFTENHHKRQSMSDILIVVGVGAIAGWLAGMIVGADGQSFLLDVIIGIVGGYIASRWIFHGTWSLSGYYYVDLTLTATVGAAILALVIKLIRGVIKV